MQAQQQRRERRDERPRQAAEARWAEARPLFDVVSPEANARARGLLQEALELDPGFARALGHLSYAYVRDHLYDWETDVPDPLGRADELAGAALAAEPDDFESHWSVGIVRLYQGEAAEALSFYGRARELCPETDPAFPTLVSEMVEALLAAGRAPEAVAQAEDAIARQRRAGDGRVPGWFLWNLGYARLAAGDARGALEVLEGVDEAERSPFLLLDLAAAYQRASGQVDDGRARAAVERCLERVECRAETAGRQPFAASLPREEYLDALRAIGLR